MAGVAKQKVLRAPKEPTPVIAAEHATTEYGRRKRFLTLAEQAAGDFLMHVNYMYPGAKELFPEQPKMWTVDKYFPFAEGGPLYVDEPMLQIDEERCEEKAKAMKELNLRYIAIKRDMTLLDVMERLA